MSLELPYSIRILDSSPVDIWYGPYDTIGDALSSVPVPVRLNRTVKIGSVEYWWDGGTADEDLVVKTAALSGLTAGRIPFSISDSELSDSANMTWDDTNLRLKIGTGSITSGIKNVNFGSDTTLSGSWSLTIAEESIIRGNNSLSSGWSHEVGDGLTSPSGSGTLTTGTDHKNFGNVSVISGVGGRVLSTADQRGGFVHAFNGPSVDGKKPSDVPYLTAAGGAGNISRNTSAQIDGYGALAQDSFILGGIDGHIPADAPRSVILGGNGIQARAGEPDNVYVPYLNITQIDQDDDLTQIAVIDPLTGQVKWRDASTIVGGITNSATDGQLAISDGTNLYGVSGISYNNLTDTLTFSSYIGVADTSLTASKSGVGVLLDVNAIEYNISIGNTGSYTSGPQGAIAIFDAVIPPSTSITNGVFLYSEGGVLKTRDSAGVVTILSGSGAGGSMSIGALDGTTKSANGAAIDGSTLYMQTADATYPGLVSTGAQTFVGSKTFSSNATFNGWITLNSRVPIGTNSFFLTDATNGFRVHNSDNTAVLLKLTNSGNIGIGTNSPNAPLQFANTTGRKIVLWENGNNDHQYYGIGLDGVGPRFQIPTTTADFYWYAGTSSTTSTELMRLTGTGTLSGKYLHFSDYLNVGAGSYKVAINGQSDGYILIRNSALDEKISLYASTGVGTATDWVATSDRRLKENIKPVDDQLSKIIAISRLVCNYDRIDTGKNETGFIAQELFKVAPEYVITPQNSGYYTVNYSKMVVPLYRGVAVIKNEIEELKQQLQEIKTKLLQHGITL